MSNPSILVIDCEIVNMIPDKKKPKIDGLMYCEGWGDYVGMGISVIGTYSYLTNEYVAYTEKDFELFKKILRSYDVLSGDIIAGFNNVSFDYPLMAAHGLYVLDVLDYDIYREVKKAAKAGKFDPGYNLDAIAKANGLSGKTGHGEFAPKLWQEGKHQEVIDYCLQDVRITKEILDLIIAGKLRNPVRPDEILDVRKPGAEA